MITKELNEKFGTNIPEVMCPEEVANPAKWEKDVWADPVSEFDACRLTSEVYEKVYGIDGLVESGFPATDSPLHDGNIGYHVRTGDHNLYRFDWHAYMDFADKKLK